MKNHFLYLFILLFLLKFNTLNAQNFDTKSIDKFWELTAHLKQDKSISDSLWTDFYNQKANKIWFDASRNLDKNYPESYRKCMEIVFMPSKKEVLNGYLKNINSRGLDTIFVKGLYEDYALNEAGLRQFYKRMTETAYMDSVYVLASKMLPKNFVKPQKKLDTLNIFIHGIESSAMAGRKGIFFALAGLYTIEKTQFGALGGHELHHILRESGLKETIDSTEEFAVLALEDCLNEGSADLINVPNVINQPKFERLRGFQLEGSEDILKTLDNWLKTAYLSKGETHKTYREVQALFRYSGGHNPGYFMADVIERNSFWEDLRANITNPFYFLKLYQKAAKKDLKKPFLFSKDSLKYVAYLEKKYLKNN
jgi:Putative zinc dependent peptidase (DUF5700)